MHSKLLNKNFVMVVIGQIISLFGNSVLRFALSLYILDITGSAVIFGSITALSIVPTILLSPLGGIAADRINKRNIMVALDFGTAAIVFCYVLINGTGLLNTIPLCAILMVLLSVIQSFYNPSVQASVPILQSPGNLVRSNAIVNQISSLSGLLGPILAGVLYGLIGAIPIIVVSAFCFAASAILEIFIQIPHQKPSGQHRIGAIIKVDFSESIQFMRKDRPAIVSVMLCIAAFNLFTVSMLTIGLPYMVRINLGMSSELLGFLEGMMAFSGILGGFAAGLFAKRFATQRLQHILMLIGFSTIPMGFMFLRQASAASTYIVLVACSMLVQFFATIFSIFILSAAQKCTPVHMLGKVMSYLITFSMCAQPIGQTLYGLLFDTLSSNIHTILFGTAAISVVIGLLSKTTFSTLSKYTTQAAVPER